MTCAASISDSFDQDLAEAVVENARRYTILVSDVVADLLPEYKTREVSHYGMSAGVHNNIVEFDISVRVQN